MDPIQSAAQGTASVASRELMWNLGTTSHVLMYVLMLVSFAILARETVRGKANNVPSATGADRAVVLGKIVPGLC